MRNIICIIDDRTIFPKRMMESLSLYCKDNHRKFDAEFVIVNVNDSFRERFQLEEQDAKPYTIGKVKEEMFENIPFLVLDAKIKDIKIIDVTKDFLNDIKTVIGSKQNDKILFLMNHGCMLSVDTKLLAEQTVGFSMKLYDEILSENHKCLLYTSIYYSESVRKAWKKMLEMFIPKRKAPDFLEREKLYMSYFDVKTARKIVDEFDAD